MPSISDYHSHIWNWSGDSIFGVSSVQLAIPRDDWSPDRRRDETHPFPSETDPYSGLA